MSLARSWGRKVYAALAAMLVIPATIVCLLLALAFAIGSTLNRVAGPRPASIPAARP